MGFDRGFQEGEDGQLREAPIHHGCHHTLHESEALLVPVRQQRTAAEAERSHS